MRFVLLGPPGAGKGTQAVGIAKNYSVRHYSSGDAIRSQIKGQTDLGLKAKAFAEHGDLVPDELVTPMVLAGLDGDECKDGWLLDGFPRVLDQAAALDAYLVEKGQKLDAVIDICLEDAVIASRLTNRRFCPACGWTCNLLTIPPKTDGICDRCGAPIEQRKDDCEETILNRLRVYHDQTEPLEEFFEKKGILLRISGEGGPDEVYGRIEAALGQR